MVRGVEEILKSEFGKSLSDESVHILDATWLQQPRCRMLNNGLANIGDRIPLCMFSSQSATHH
jgi:hypothetical protein